MPNWRSASMAAICDWRTFTASWSRSLSRSETVSLTFAARKRRVALQSLIEPRPLGSRLRCYEPDKIRQFMERDNTPGRIMQGQAPCFVRIVHHQNGVDSDTLRDLQTFRGVCQKHRLLRFKGCARDRPSKRLCFDSP